MVQFIFHTLQVLITLMHCGCHVELCSFKSYSMGFAHCLGYEAELFPVEFSSRDCLDHTVGCGYSCSEQRKTLLDYVHQTIPQSRHSVEH